MNIRVDKENKNTVVFIAVFICAGIIYMLSFLDDPMISVFLYCLNYIIYIGLLLFWIQSVHERLLPTRERKYVIGAAIFMLIFLTQRVFKYRVASDNTVARYTGYAYFVPEMFITAFFLMTCIRIYFGKRKNVKEYLFLIPVVIFVVIVLTNDVHNLVYIPKVELNDFYIQAGTYNYGVMFYVLYIWMITTMLAGIVLLFNSKKKIKKSGKIMMIIVALTWIALIALLKFVFDRFGTIRPYNMPEIYIFGLLAIFEICIRSKLIPSNEKYPEFFYKLEFPAVITDIDLNPVYNTDIPINITKEDMEASIEKDIYINKDTRLSGKKISGGFLFFLTSEKELNRLNEQLMDVNEILDTENTLIEAENRQREEIARMDFYNSIYQQIAKELYPTQKKVENLLDNITLFNDYRFKMAQVCVLNAYIKRMTSILLMRAENELINSRELLLALKESARYMEYLGIKTEANSKTCEDIESDMAYELYKTFEQLIEFLLEKIHYLTITLLDGNIRLVVDCEHMPQLPDTKLPVKGFLDDGLLYLTIFKDQGGE